MPSYKLTYFNLRGRGETPRVIMAYGGIDYEDVRIPSSPREEWAKIKPMTPFGQVPVLEVDGVQICQGQAISRFLAKKVGLHGKSDIEEAKIDMIVGCLHDMSAPLPAMRMETHPTKKAELKKACKESFGDGLTKLENLVEGDYFLGNQMSWADIAFTVGMEFTNSGAVGMDMPLDKLPKLAGLISRVRSQPKIAAWIAKRPATPF